MPVDRAARYALATAMADFMRGDAPEAALAPLLPPDPHATDRSLEGIKADLRDWCDPDNRPGRAPLAHVWHAWRRVLAFLLSDLELELVRRHVLRECQAFAFTATLLLLLAVGAASHAGHWLFLAIAWLPSYVAVRFIVLRRQCPPHPDVEPLRRFAPFRSESQWRKHEPALGPLRLPPEPPQAELASKPSLASIDAVLELRILALVPLIAVLNLLPARDAVWLVRDESPFPHGLSEKCHSTESAAGGR